MVGDVGTATGPSDLVEKWGASVADRGFAQIPNYLLFINQFLDDEHTLSAIELLVLIELTATWWKKTELPYPSMSTLAARAGVSERQVQRAVTRLEKLGILRRVKRRSSGIIASNAYDLSPLVALLEKIAFAYPNAYPRRQKGSEKRAVAQMEVRADITKVAEPLGLSHLADAAPAEQPPPHAPPDRD